jgi:hypothetical protein
MTEPTAHERLTRAGLSAQFADLVLARHATELAEKVRAARGTTSLECGHHFFSGMDFAADLIDPKAQR